jgi:hypothetical protein
VGVAGGVAAFRVVRVGACADELRLMGVVRRVFSTGEIRVVGRGGSLVRNSSSACVPPGMERMWRGPCGEGAIWTMQFVERGGGCKERLCAMVSRFLATKGSKS